MKQGISEDVVVTKALMDVSTWGLYAMCVMQVCAFCEVPPKVVERRANELNPAGTDGGWRIVWGTSDDPDEIIDIPNKAPVKCEQDSARIHYLLSC